MTFEPGQSGNPKGREPGSKNKITTFKGASNEVFELMGGVQGFWAWAEENPGDFYKTIMARMIPKEVNLSGPEGGDHKIIIIRAKPEEVKQPDGKPTDTTKTIPG